MQTSVENSLARIQKIQKNGVIIYDDNQKMQLAGIILQKNGRAHIEKLAAGRSVKIHLHPEISPAGDIAQGDIELLPGFFLSRELLKSGHALMFPFYIPLKQATDFRALEAIARANYTGIWRRRKNPPMVTAQDADNFIGQYKIVAGKITKHDLHKGIVYLNFGADWSDDFTVRAPEKIFDDIAKINRWPQDMTGKTIQCRGILHKFYGAALDLSHPGQCHLP